MNKEDDTAKKVACILAAEMENVEQLMKITRKMEEMIQEQNEKIKELERDVMILRRKVRV